MCKYKIYIDYGSGLEKIGMYDGEKMIKVVDNIIKNDSCCEIIVIERDMEKVWDNPIFIYLGNNEDSYRNFREKFITKNKIKTLMKK